METEKKVVPFETVLNSLHWSYIKPKESDKNNMSKFYILSVAIRTYTFLLAVVGAVLHFLKVIIEPIKEIDPSEDIVVILGGTGALLSTVAYTVYYKDWDRYLNELMDFSLYGKPKNIDKFLKKGNFLGMLVGNYYICGVFIYGIISYIEGLRCNKIVEEKHYNLMCNTLLPIHLPFQLKKKIYLYLIFFQQMCVVMMTVKPAALVTFLVYECAEVIGLHIEALNDHFKTIIVEKNVRTRPDGIGYWVRYHNHIFRLAVTLRTLLKKCIGLATLISAIVFGCVENQVVRGVKPLGAIVFFIGWLVALMLLCLSGQILMNKTFSVSHNIIESNWHLADLKTKRDIVLILLRSQKPVYLEIMPLGSLNYSLLVMILRASYSYMTLLNN